MTRSAGITHDIAAEAFCDAFRRRVGRGQGKISMDELSDIIDIDVRTLKAWRDGETVPQWHKMLRLCDHFGPAFSSEILTPAGQGGVERVQPAPVDAQGTATDLAATVSDLLERLRDGKFCHLDRAKTGPQLLGLAHALEAQGRAMIGGDEATEALRKMRITLAGA